MEDTLRVNNMNKESKIKAVLILVVMEDTLKGGTWRHKDNNEAVLILVLMEDTLRDISTYSC